MKFKKTSINHIECYISGRYKVIKYDKWYAHFIPNGWKNWGQSCQVDSSNQSKGYKNRIEAQKICALHAAKYNNPIPTDRI